MVTHNSKSDLPLEVVVMCTTFSLATPPMVISRHVQSGNFTPSLFNKCVVINSPTYSRVASAHVRPSDSTYLHNWCRRPTRTHYVQIPRQQTGCRSFFAPNFYVYTYLGFSAKKKYCSGRTYSADTFMVMGQLAKLVI